jgi:hypothetical protein
MTHGKASKLRKPRRPFRKMHGERKKITKEVELLEGGEGGRSICIIATATIYR